MKTCLIPGYLQLDSLNFFMVWLASYKYRVLSYLSKTGNQVA